MIEPLKDILIIFGRIVTILPLMLFMTIYMGKRAIGQLPIFDFLIILTLGSLVGADIAEPSIHHFPTAVAIIMIAVLQRFVAKMKISNRTFGRLVTFEPTVVVQNGRLLEQNMKRIKYSIDNILQMLREKEVFDLSEVETAIIESNGSMSVLKNSEKIAVTREDLNLEPKITSITFPVIMEGSIYSKVLKDFNLTEDWLIKELSSRGIYHIKEIFFASINHNHELHISLINEKQMTVPPVEH